MFALCWRAARGRFFSVSLVTMALGAVSVRRAWGCPLWPAFPLILLGGLLVHAGANLWNDYADDLNGTDRANAHPTPFNGGSRVIQRGELSPAAVRFAALACFAGALIVAGILARRGGGWGVPILTALGIALSIGYSTPPVWLSGRGLGELTVAVCFGPLLAAGTSLAMAGKLAPSSLLASIPLGLLVAAILTLNAIPDRAPDRIAAKGTLAVRRGSAGAIAVYRALLAAAFLILLWAAAAGTLGRHGWLPCLASVPAALLFIRVGSLAGGASERFPFLAGATVALHLSLGLLIIAGIAG